MADTGFEIYGRIYPIAESFRLGDPILIKELTGLDFPSFAEAYDEMVDEIAMRGDEADVDPEVLVGLVGVAVWQANPSWRRDKAVRFVQGLPMDAVKIVGEPDDGDDDGPPADAPAATVSGGTPADSSSSAGATANQNGSGDPTSPIGAASA